MTTQAKNQDEMQQVIQTLGNPKNYKKFSTAQIRKATIGETIVTMVNGEQETTNTVKEDSVIVKGPAGEEYAVRMTIFKDRYEGPELSEEYQTFNATGKINAVEYKGEAMKFIASWGEEMLVKEGDMLSTTPGSVYRIEKDVFALSYKEEDEALV